MPRWMKVVLGFVVGTTVGVILMSPYCSVWKVAARRVSCLTQSPLS